MESSQTSASSGPEATSQDNPPTAARRIADRISAMGSAAQATVPGAYAWAVTVAPVAWSHGAGTLSKMGAIVALIALGAGSLGERMWGRRGRLASLWGFVLASATSWSAAPDALASRRIDAPHGLAGMLGWGLFGLVLAAPSLEGSGRPATVPDAGPPIARRRLARADAVCVLGAAAIAVSMQFIGWGVASAERALLVRFVALAAGLAVIDAGATVALAQHARRVQRPVPARLRSSMVPLVALGMLALAGLLFALRG